MNEVVADKAHKYIIQGYQRLLSFECDSGGFSWWCGAPEGNGLLTMLGLLEFTDMSQVIYVDPEVILRSRDFVLDLQKQDGSWAGYDLYSGNNEYAEGSLRATAMAVWSLTESGYSGPALASAVIYIKAALVQEEDPYSLALAANALAAVDPADPSLVALLDALKAMAVDDGETVHWQGGGPSLTGTVGGKLDAETTALAVLAMISAGKHGATSGKALDWLIQAKSGCGWGSSQATILTLRAFVEAVLAGSTAAAGEVSVTVNGVAAGEVDLSGEAGQVLHYVDLTGSAGSGDNDVVLSYQGDGGAFFQLIHSYHVPWPAQGPPGDLGLDVTYSPLTVAVGEEVEVSTTVTNLSGGVHNMVMASVGIPPGFTVLPSLLNDAVEEGDLENFEVKGRHLVYYLGSMAPGETRTLSVSMVPSLPVEAQAPAGEAYLYYNSEIRADTPSVPITVLE